MNGDGLQDILIGDFTYGFNATYSSAGGRATVIFGQEGGMESLVHFNDLPSAGQGAILNGYFDSAYGIAAGFSIAGGDINGDGCDDIFVGARFGNSSTGVVHVIYGADQQPE